jgi:hypothetical protein
MNILTSYVAVMISLNCVTNIAKDDDDDDVGGGGGGYNDGCRQ